MSMKTISLITLGFFLGSVYGTIFTAYRLEPRLQSNTHEIIEKHGEIYDQMLSIRK
jgi:hypothetical protein